MPSYSPVYSSQFIVNSFATGYSNFLVPDGFTAVIRTCSAWWGDGVGAAQIVIQDSEAAPGVTIAGLLFSGDIPGYAKVDGHWALPAGGIISTILTTIGTDPDIYVGGYLLRNTLT